MSGYHSSEPAPNVKGCWYLIEIEECPVCGRSKEYRTRMPAPRPEDPAERYSFEHVWDYCDL